MSKKPALITLGRVTAVVHKLIYIVAGAGMGHALRQPPTPTTVSFVIFGLLLMVFTVLTKFVFNNDCALRIFEYCLRGLGGQEINHNRLNSMSTPQARLMNPEELYRHLLWRSTLFLIVATVICVGGATAAAILI